MVFARKLFRLLVGVLALLALTISARPTAEAQTRGGAAQERTVVTATTTSTITYDGTFRHSSARARTAERRDRIGRPLRNDGTVTRTSARPGLALVAAETTTEGVDIGATTTHGAKRVAGAGATRGGVLSPEQILQVRGSGQVWSQADGAAVRILQNSAGRYDVVVDGERGLITTFSNPFAEVIRPTGWQLWVDAVTSDASICCFCGLPLEPARTTTLVVYPPTEPDEAQTLFCHGKCLVDRLSPTVPHHPILDDE